MQAMTIELIGQGITDNNKTTWEESLEMIPPGRRKIGRPKQR